MEILIGTIVLIVVGYNINQVRKVSRLIDNLEELEKDLKPLNSIGGDSK